MPFPSDILQIILDYIYTDEALAVKGEGINTPRLNGIGMTDVRRNGLFIEDVCGQKESNGRGKTGLKYMGEEKGMTISTADEN